MQFGDDVTVFTTNALDTVTFSGRAGRVMEPGETMENGVRVHRFPMKRGYLPRKFISGVADKLHLPHWDTLRAIHQGPLIPGLANAVATSGADVVMAMAFPLWHMFAAQKGAEKAGIPMIFTGAIHPADEWGYNRPMIFDAIRRADGYIALTPFEKAFLVEHDISAEKITVVGSGITSPPDPFPSFDITRQRLNISFGVPMILALGRQNSRKRFSFLLEAMPQVWRQFPNTQVVFAGATAEATPLLQQLEDTRVHILNDVSEAEKHALLSTCNILVLPSTEESFGIVFAEAWAHGKPVIGANIGAVRSLIADGVDGLLFEHNSADSLAQAIRTLLANPGLQARLGNAGKQKVFANYTWEVIATKVRTVYLSIVK